MVNVHIFTRSLSGPPKFGGPEKGRLDAYCILILQISSRDCSFSVRINPEFRIWLMSFQNCLFILKKFCRFCLVLALQVLIASSTSLFIF